MATLPSILDAGPEELTEQQQQDKTLQPCLEAVDKSEEFVLVNGLL